MSDETERAARLGRLTEWVERHRFQSDDRGRITGDLAWLLTALARGEAERAALAAMLTEATARLWWAIDLANANAEFEYYRDDPQRYVDADRAARAERVATELGPAIVATRDKASAVLGISATHSPEAGPHVERIQQALAEYHAAIGKQEG